MAVLARHIFSLNQMQTKQKYGTIVLKSFKWKSNAAIWCENSIKSQTCFVSTFYVYCIVKSIQVECCCFCFFCFCCYVSRFRKAQEQPKCCPSKPYPSVEYIALCF